MPLHTVHALISHPAAAWATPTTAQLHTREIKGQQLMQPFSSAILCDSSVWDSHPPHISHPSLSKTPDHDFKGPDGNGATGHCCGGLRWMSRDSKGCGWCMIVCERGDRGGGPEIACFNLSLWTWPLSQLYSSCSNTCQVSSFLLPTHCFSQIWFLVVGKV